MTDANFVLPPGSLILVTGVNGLIASHVADQLLSRGYRIRGTVRDIEKSDWVRERFENQYGEGLFELAIVKDMAMQNAFDEVIKGVSGVIHLATVVTFSADPKEVIPPTVAGVTSALEAAAATPSVTRFVYTSSSSAALIPKPNVRRKVNSSTWNNESVRIAWSGESGRSDMSYQVYAASKTEAEQAVWRFVEEQKPRFTTAAVLPNMNVGPLMHPTKQPGSSSGWTLGMYQGNEKDTELMRTFPPQYYIDVRDCALLHLGALLLPSIKGGERLFGFAEPYNFNKLLETFKKISPDKHFAPPIEGEGEDFSEVDTERALEVLLEMGKSGGWNSLETGVRAVIESVE